LALVSDGGWEIFIAYPSPERASATDLHHHLCGAGAHTFVDHRSLRPGDPWVARISAAQREARVTAVLVSNTTSRAFYQQEEIAQAIALFRDDPDRHRVVPVYLDDEVDPPYGLRSIHAIRVAEVGDMAAVAASLLALVRPPEPGARPRQAAPGTVRAVPAPARASPFRPGMPLYATDLLCGASRRALLSTIAADVSGGTNVNLVAERRMGRTSMLNHLSARLFAAEFVVARVNLQDGVPTDGAFYGAVLWGMGQSPHGEQAITPRRVAELEDVPLATYPELRRVLRALRHATTTVLLLDEFESCFDSPTTYPFPGFFDNLRSILGGDEQGPYARAVVATRDPLASYFARHQLTSTLPSYLPMRRMELLGDGDVDEALAQDSPHALGPAQREEAAHLAARHPCRLQSAGEAWYRALDGGHDGRWAAVEFARLSEQTCIGATPDNPGQERACPVVDP